MAESLELNDLTGQSPPAPQVSDDLVVKCTQLIKVFRDFWFRNRVRAVDKVDLDVRRGEVFGLLGPNGSGKSTTIKMLLGLLHATSGRIAVFGKRPEDVSIKKQIGYLPEESYLYRFLNARETLDYYGRLFYQGRTQRQGRIDMLLKMVGLEAVQRRPVGEYSKGMQRRIGLAQALINDPQLLVLDEPTTGLDPIGTRQIKDLILTLRQRGKTILLCSHLLADVEDVCDRVAVMYGGKIKRHGSVDELLTQQNMTTLQTETLDAETIEEIDALLTRRGKHIERIDHPRQKLETLFLDIVHEATARGEATSGASSGGQVADFLAGEGRAAHLPESVEAEKVIDQLMGEPQAQEEAPPPPPAPPTPQPDQEDQSVLAGLTAQEPPPPQTGPQPIPPETEPVPVDHSVIEELTIGNQQPTSDDAEPQTVGEQPSSPPESPPAPPPELPPEPTPEPVEQPTEPAEARIPPTPAQAPTQPTEPPAEPEPSAESTEDQQPQSESEPGDEQPPDRERRDGERPDPGFLDALRDVPGFDRDEKSKDSSPGGSP